MAEHKIVRYCLQSRATQLKAEKKSYRDISKILSSESGHNISNTSIQRYFESIEQAKVEAVEKSDKLKARVAEAEINTIDEAMYCVTTLKAICEDAKESKDYKTVIQAIDKIYPALDVINKVLGKYQLLPQHTFNNSDVQINLQLIDCSKRGD